MDYSRTKAQFEGLPPVLTRQRAVYSAESRFSSRFLWPVQCWRNRHFDAL